MFVQIMPQGPKMAPPCVHMFYIGRTMKKSSCMKHHLVNLNQVGSNYIPGAKNGPPSGHMFYREKHVTIFLTETIRLRALIFGM